MRAMVEDQIEAESQAFFLSGRLYDDGIIDPRDTRSVLGMCLSVIDGAPGPTGRPDGRADRPRGRTGRCEPLWHLQDVRGVP